MPNGIYQFILFANNILPGVSYIGGDPCGSKYNSDPFDTKSSKPGLPDDMKSRIQAIAEQKIKSMKEAKEE